MSAGKIDPMEQFMVEPVLGRHIELFGYDVSFTNSALFMIVVFIAFGVTGPIPPTELGITLAVAVLLDATIVRMMLVPSIMGLLGERNWWLPRWLGRILPTISPAAPSAFLKTWPRERPVRPRSLRRTAERSIFCSSSRSSATLSCRTGGLGLCGSCELRAWA